MASDSKRAALIFAGVAAVAAAAGIYFFKVYRPAQVRGEARVEITAWEQRWGAARECVLGASPASSKTSEALAIREMSNVPAPRSGCTERIAKLTRGEGADSGMPDVENAWAALDKAAGKVANAFATHVASSTTVLDDPLPVALDALDAARAALRAAARMPAATIGGSPLPVAQLVPVQDGADPIESVDYMSLMPSAHGLVAVAMGKHGRLQITFVTGGAPRVERMPGTVMRSTADASFGAQPTNTGVQFGAVGADGAIATPATIAIAKPILDMVGGSLADGVLVYGTELPPPLKAFIAHVKAGQATVDAVQSIDTLSTATDADGRVVLITGSRESAGARFFGPGAAPDTVDLGRSARGAPCFTRDRLWVATAQDGEVSYTDGKPSQAALGFGGGKPVYQVAANAQLLGCTSEAALFHVADSADNELLVCTDACRVVKPIVGAPTAAVLTVVAGKLVAVAEHAGVLGVWREGAAPLFYALPAPARPVLAYEFGAMAMTDGKVIDVLARGAKTFSIIRIPAPPAW